jgi:hypothetical protein
LIADPRAASAEGVAGWVWPAVEMAAGARSPDPATGTGVVEADGATAGVATVAAAGVPETGDAASATDERAGAGEAAGPGVSAGAGEAAAAGGAASAGDVGVESAERTSTACVGEPE